MNQTEAALLLVIFGAIVPLYFILRMMTDVVEARRIAREKKDEEE